MSIRRGREFIIFIENLNIDRGILFAEMTIV